MDTREDNTSVEGHTESQSQHEQNDWEPRELIDKEAFVSGPFELEALSPLLELDAVRHPNQHDVLDLPSDRTALHIEQSSAAINQQSRRSSASTAVDKQESLESQVHQLCTGFDPDTHCDDERDTKTQLGPPFIYEGGCPYQFGQKKFRLIEMDGESAFDSLGYGSYIRVSDTRTCTATCGCMRSHFPSAFSFIVKNTIDGIRVNILSVSLWEEVMKVLPSHMRPTGRDREIDGHILFRFKLGLKIHLENVYSRILQKQTYAVQNSPSLELELLVHGFLDDDCFWQRHNIDDNRIQSHLNSHPAEKSDFDGGSTDEDLLKPKLTDFSPWKKLRAQWKSRWGNANIETKIDRLVNAFRSTDETYAPEFKPSLKSRPTMYQFKPTPSEIDDMSVDPLMMSPCPRPVQRGLPDISVLDDDVLDLNEGSDGLELRNKIIEPNDEMFELYSGELITHEDLNASRAKSLQAVFPSAKDPQFSPNFGKKLAEVRFSVNDWIMNAAMNGEFGLVQTLLNLGTDTEGK
ncbi:hypothetical protein CGLO_01293 [Colletotrichum gloeosporioides Cg-14]|uniref:Uncharacterized protein n=1 Tax=Colletotrichum gloeosporioides (strain Cg-14) TaxID=1237896 RepID=T0L0T4_COLGC|nr:hypothetical protein CGLO_01293 [Colletotrichum gloeosporioides Cg-14]